MDAVAAVALDDLLKLGQEGNAAACEPLVKLARKLRQNLERSFRLRLDPDRPPLQDRKPVGKYARD